MHRFYLAPDQFSGDELFLTGREAHHALDVLRLRRGERVTVLDGAGRQFLCETQAHDRDKLRLNILEKRKIPPPPYRITLLQAVPKGKLIESIIQKATELGAFRVIPLLSERVVTHLDEKGSVNKAEKWQGVAVEAIKQCGAAWLPRVEPPTTPQEFIARGEKFELPLIASLQAGSKHPRAYFREFEKTHRRLPSTVSMWVGPEGDFSPEEYGLIQKSGALPISLGQLVLRAETAAIYCLSILNYELAAGADLR